MKESIKKWINSIFLCILACLLAAGLVRTLFLPKEINEYENRYAEQVKPLTLSSYVNSEFQDSVELALGDQIPGAEKMKEAFNDAFSAYSSGLVRRIFHLGKPQVIASEKSPSGNGEQTAPDDTPDHAAENTTPPEDTKDIADASEGSESEDIRNAEQNAEQTPINNGQDSESNRQPAEFTGEETLPEDNCVMLTDTDPETWPNLYIQVYGNTFLYRNHLLFAQQYLDYVTGVVDGWLSYVKEAVDRNPNAVFYGYYIEKDSDIDFISNKKSGVSEYVVDHVAIPKERMGIFRVNSFKDFDAYFFHTDHHWKADGSYKGYQEILSMILPGEQPLPSLGKVEIGTMKGSKQSGDAAIYTEMLRVNEYAFPGLSIFENGLAGGYGGQEYYIKGAKNGKKFSNVTYGQFYGTDNGETRFHNAASANGSILLVGESFDNAILKLLASHFTDLYSIDLRNYEAQIGRPFDITTYLTENKIERVLLIGGMEYWYGRTPLCSEQEGKDGIQ